MSSYVLRMGTNHKGSLCVCTSNNIGDYEPLSLSGDFNVQEDLEVERSVEVTVEDDKENGRNEQAEEVKMEDGEEITNDYPPPNEELAELVDCFLQVRSMCHTTRATCPLLVCVLQ